LAEYAGSYAEFFAKEFAKEFGWPPGGTQPADLWYDVLYYGRIDEKQRAIYIPDRLISTRLSTLPSEESDELALDFVSTAYGEFLAYVNRAKMMGRLSPGGFLRTLEVKRGWESVDRVLAAHWGAVRSLFSLHLENMDLHKKINNFKDYVHQFQRFVLEYGNDMPITRTGFVTSNWCPQRVSGLMIELDTPDHADDEVRDKYLSDPNFTFYKIATKKFGFMIDKYAPWRIIADISSYPMQKYMVGDSENARLEKEGVTTDLGTSVDRWNHPFLKFKPGTATNLFSTWFKYGAGDGLRSHGYYRRSYETDIIELYYNLAKNYNEYVTALPFLSKKVVSKCHGGLVSVEPLPRREPVDLNPFERKMTFSLGVVFTEGQAKQKWSTVKRHDYIMYHTAAHPKMAEHIDEIASMTNSSTYDILKGYFEIRLAEENIKMTRHDLKQNLLKIKKLSKSYASGLAYIDKKLRQLQPNLAFSLDISQKNGTLITNGAPAPQGPSGGTTGGGGY